MRADYIERGWLPRGSSETRSSAMTWCHLCSNEPGETRISCTRYTVGGARPTKDGLTNCISPWPERVVRSNFMTNIYPFGVNCIGLCREGDGTPQKGRIGHEKVSIMAFHLTRYHGIWRLGSVETAPGDLLYLSARNETVRGQGSHWFD